jgi:hypothetical protein
MGDIGETQKRYRHKAYYQQDYSSMKTDLLYEKFISRGALMHQSQQSLKELHGNARSKSTLGNHNLDPVVSHAYQKMEPVAPKKSWNNHLFINQKNQHSALSSYSKMVLPAKPLHLQPLTLVSESGASKKKK